MFRNETASVTRRASNQSEGSQSASQSGPSSCGTRQPSPEKETVAKQFFFNEFVTPSHLSFLEGLSPDEFLIKPIIACALAAIANRENDVRGREVARRYYVEAITATNAALPHPRRVKEDNTLVSVYLLSIFEVRCCTNRIAMVHFANHTQRISWEPPTSLSSWRHHVDGSAQVLQLRGRNQVRTKAGALLFREVREPIVRILSNLKSV